MKWAWKTTVPTHVSKLVLLAISNYANDETGICWPSISTLAKDCHLSRQAVLDQITILMGGQRDKTRHGKLLKGTGLKYLEIVEQRHGTSNKYRVLLVKPLDYLPVQPLDYPADFAGQGAGLHQSSPLTSLVKGLDPIHKEPLRNQNCTRFLSEARAIIAFMNKNLNRNFRETPSNLSIIASRFKEGGVDLAGVQTMISRQISLWQHDPLMAPYLRIETLFRASKFDSYYSAKDLPLLSSNGKSSPRGQAITKVDPLFGEYYTPNNSI